MRKKIGQKRRNFFQLLFFFVSTAWLWFSNIFARDTFPAPFRSVLYSHSSWKLLTNSWVSKARKRNENNRKQTSVSCKIVATSLCVFRVQRPTICFANIHTNEIYVKLILNWLWNAHSSWPDILCALFLFANSYCVVCVDEWTGRNEWVSEWVYSM